MTERMHAANVGYALFDSQVVLYNDGETSTRSEHPPGPVPITRRGLSPIIFAVNV